MAGRLFILSITLLLVLLPGVAPCDKLFLFAGQSNMVGLGDDEDIPETWRELPSNVALFEHSSLTGMLPAPTELFGPEVSAAQKFAARWPEEDIIIVKFAYGGSSLYDWAPLYDPELAQITDHPEYGSLYAKLFDFLNSLPLDGARFDGIAWMQGETDARHLQPATEYAENFTEFISRLRHDVASPETPFVFGEINPEPRYLHPPYTEAYPYVDLVREHQVSVAATVPGTRLVETDDLPRRSDGAHYTSEGMLKLGERFARELIRTVDPEPPSAQGWSVR